MKYCIDCGIPINECPCNEEEISFSHPDNSYRNSIENLFDERDYAQEADY